MVFYNITTQIYSLNKKTMKKNFAKRYSSISEFEKDIIKMNESWYFIQCISENNWRVLAVYILDSKEENNEEIKNADSWWTSA